MPGCVIVSLSEEERVLVQRFEPSSSLDTNGFFIAKFVVNRTLTKTPTLVAAHAIASKEDGAYSMVPSGHNVMSTAASRGIFLHTHSVALTLGCIRQRRVHVPSVISTVPHVRLKMRFVPSKDRPLPRPEPLCAPFSLRRFRSSHAAHDAAAWSSISARGHTIDRFHAEFGARMDILPRRMFFLCLNGQVVGTSTAWMGEGEHPLGRLHFVALAPEARGLGLARTLVHTAMSVLVKHYSEVYLMTQPASARAIKLYFEFGFRPELPQGGDERAEQIQAWRSVGGVIGNSGILSGIL